MHNKHRSTTLTLEQRQLEMAHLLEPSYQPQHYASTSTSAFAASSSYSSTASSGLGLAGPSSPLASASASSSASAPSSLSRKVYTDALGNVHDPAFKLFPNTDEYRLARRSFESYSRRQRQPHSHTYPYRDDDDDDDTDEEEEEYGDGSFGKEYYHTLGGIARSRHHHHHQYNQHQHHPSPYRRSNFATPTPIHTPTHTLTYSPPTGYSFSYPITIADPVSSPVVVPAIVVIDDDEKSMSHLPHQHSGTGTGTSSPSPRSAFQKLHTKLFARRPSFELYDEDAEWDDDDDDDDEEDEVDEADEKKMNVNEKREGTRHRRVHSETLSEKSEPRSQFDDDDDDDDVAAVGKHESTPTCTSAFTDMRKAAQRRWQYIQLSVQLSIFRTNRRWRRRLLV